jgi:hypothetical protein
MSLALALLTGGLIQGRGGGGGGGGGGRGRAIGPLGGEIKTVLQILITFWAFFTLFSKFIVIFARSSLAVSLTRLPSTFFVTRKPNFLALFLKSRYCI